MTVAFLCAGQGAQNRDMLRVVAGHPAARPVLDAAGAALGCDLVRFVAEAPEAALFANRAGQVLTVAAAVAWWTALGSEPPAIVAGYSVGQVAALACAGVIAPQAAPAIAAARAECMDRAAPPGAGLAAVTGLAHADVAALARAHGLAVAIDNGPGSVVLGGAGDALEAALAAARARGAARAVRLPVAVPSHTPLLAAATPAFRRVLEDAKLRAPDPAIHLIDGLAGDRVWTIADAVAAASDALSTTIHWASCQEVCMEAGATRLLEIGPGRALARMAAEREETIPVRAAADFQTIEGVRAWLRGD